MRRPSSPTEIVYTYDFKEFIKQFHLPKPQLEPYEPIPDIRKEVKTKKQVNLNKGITRELLIQQQENKHQKPEIDKKFLQQKIVIKRRVLNDYISIVNKRGNILNEIKESANDMKIQSDKNLAYFKKWYNDQYIENLDQLFQMLGPLFKYSQGGIEANAQKFIRYVKRAEKNIQNREEEENRQRIEQERKERQEQEEQKKNNKFWYIVQQEEMEEKQKERQKMAVKTNENRIQKIKGYLQSSQDLEAGKRDIKQMKNVEKYGTNELKLEYFKQDMKKLINKYQNQDQNNNNKGQANNKQKTQIVNKTSNNIEKNQQKFPSQHKLVSMTQYTKYDTLPSSSTINNQPNNTNNAQQFQSQSQQQLYATLQPSPNLYNSSQPYMQFQNPQQSQQIHSPLLPKIQRSESMQSDHKNKKQSVNNTIIQNQQQQDENKSGFYHSSQQPTTIPYDSTQTSQQKHNFSNHLLYSPNLNNSILTTNNGGESIKESMQQRKVSDFSAKQQQQQYQNYNKKLNQSASSQNYNSIFQEVKFQPSQQFPRNKTNQSDIMYQSEGFYNITNKNRSPSFQNQLGQQQNNNKSYNKQQNIMNQTMNIQNQYENKSQTQIAQNFQQQQQKQQIQHNIQNQYYMNSRKISNDLADSALEYNQQQINQSSLNYDQNKTNSSKQMDSSLEENKTIPDGESSQQLQQSQNTQNSQQRRCFKRDSIQKNSFLSARKMSGTFYQNSLKNSKQNSVQNNNNNSKSRNSLLVISQKQPPQTGRLVVGDNQIQFQNADGSSEVQLIKKSKSPALNKQYSTVSIQSLLDSQNNYQLSDQGSQKDLGAVGSFNENIQNNQSELGQDPQTQQQLNNSTSISQTQQTLAQKYGPNIKIISELNNINENYKSDEEDDSEEEKKKKTVQKDIFKYNRLNKVFINKFYHQKLLGIQQDVTPVYTKYQLQQLEKIQNKAKGAQFSNAKSRLFEFKNTKVLEKQMLEENEQIITKHGIDILDQYSNVQRICNQELNKNKKQIQKLKNTKNKSTKDFRGVKKEFNGKLGPQKSVYWKMDKKSFVKMQEQYYKSQSEKQQQKQKQQKEQKENQKKELAKEQKLNSLQDDIELYNAQFNYEAAQKLQQESEKQQKKIEMKEKLKKKKEKDQLIKQLKVSRNKAINQLINIESQSGNINDYQQKLQLSPNIPYLESFDDNGNFTKTTKQFIVNSAKNDKERERLQKIENEKYRKLFNKNHSFYVKSNKNQNNNNND